MNKLIHCIDCNSIYAITPYDQMPEYRISEDATDYTTIERNDWADFLCQHSGHSTEELTIPRAPVYSEGSYADPHRAAYYEATNGRDVFLIKRWRKSIFEALRYDLIQGKLEVKHCIEIQKTNLQKQISHDIKEPPLAEEKVLKFIELIQQEAVLLDPSKSLTKVLETNDSQICYLPLTDEQMANILEKSRVLVTHDEWEKLERFVRNNREPDGVLSLIIRTSATFYPVFQAS